ncbi:uncharacterized protein [Diadema antillarum]|uniref:uncharacterized protein n=1 Tax=Diadema antillarum TaxID=105358 RepID=UPI003A88B441
MESYDDYGHIDVFNNLSNPEHALQSVDAVLLSHAQNIFMYEQDCGAPSSKHDLVASSPSDNIFEFPNPEEMAQLGCSPLIDNCWPETPLLAGSLDGSLNDSGVCFSWELTADEEEALCKSSTGGSFGSAPTLAELNLKDSQSTDAGMSLKRKGDSVQETPLSPPISKVLSGQQEMSLSPQSWKRVKTEVAEMANVESTKSLARLSSQRHDAPKKSSRISKPSRLSLSKSNRTKSEASRNSAKAEKLSKQPMGKMKPSKIDFTELLLKSYNSRRNDSIPSPTKEMTRSEFIARTPNPFGNRRFLGINALLKSGKRPHHHHTTLPKVVSSHKPRGRMVQQKSRTRTKVRPVRPQAVKKKTPRHVFSLDGGDDSSQDRLWKDLQEFMYNTQTKNSKKDTPNRTILSDPDVKSESSKSSRTNVSSDPGFDSHDEGLGSENEDHDDFASDEEDDDIPDDISDLSDDHGLPSTSTKPRDPSRSFQGSSQSGRRRFKTRRSEYDDFTPNPRKLLHIGHELNKLNIAISELTPGSEASNDEKNQTRREKNKLASRACRLKKKAQHEANKVKLWGLVEEAKQLKVVLKAMREDMASRIDKPKVHWDYCLGAKLDHMIKTSLGHMVAGHTSEFVNSVLEKTAKGIPLSSLKLTGMKA